MKSIDVSCTEFGALRPQYYDVFGKRHDASPETLTRLIDAMAAARIEPRALEIAE